MTDKISPRLAAIVDALPLRPGMRILEIFRLRRAAHAPVLLVLDDLQWSDAATIALTDAVLVDDRALELR